MFLVSNKARASKKDYFMRIYGKQHAKQLGYSSSGGEFGDPGEAEKRQQLFRQNKKVGQEVQGTVLRTRGENMPAQLGQVEQHAAYAGHAWIDVGGLALSAQLPFKAYPGQRLLLRIESLEPEIVLKFLKQMHASPEALQLQVYTALRDQLHNTWQNFWQNFLAIKPGNLVEAFSANLDESSSKISQSLLLSLPESLMEKGELNQLIAWTNLTSLIADGADPKELIANSFTDAPSKKIKADQAAKIVETGEFAKSEKPEIGQSVQAGQATQAGQGEEALVLGEPFPGWAVSVGEKLVNNLHKIWSKRFICELPSQTQKELAELNSIQLSTVKSLTPKGVKAWSQIPWASPTGNHRELLILQPQGQKLKQVFISGTWPGLGGVFISAMALNKQISCRVHVQNLLPFEHVVQILNLPGLGQIINLVVEKYNLHSNFSKSSGSPTAPTLGFSPVSPTPSTSPISSKSPISGSTRPSLSLENENSHLQSSITCLELKQHSPDTVPGILLRL